MGTCTSRYVFLSQWCASPTSRHHVFWSQVCMLQTIKMDEKQLPLVVYNDIFCQSNAWVVIAVISCYNNYNTRTYAKVTTSQHRKNKSFIHWFIDSNINQNQNQIQCVHHCNANTTAFVDTLSLTLKDGIRHGWLTAGTLVPGRLSIQVVSF